MKLNVGCGEFYAPGWTNMDVISNNQVKPDMIGSLTALPDQVRDVSAVYLGHVLEHLHYTEIPAVLASLWERCLPGTTVAVVGPDVRRTETQHAHGLVSAELLTRTKQGERRWPGDAHLWECDEQSLVDVLRASGLPAAPVPATSRKLDAFPVVSRASWQCAAVGAV